MAQPFAHGGDIEKEAQVTFTQIAKGAKLGKTPIILEAEIGISLNFCGIFFQKWDLIILPEK